MRGTTPTHKAHAKGPGDRVRMVFPLPTHKDKVTYLENWHDNCNYKDANKYTHLNTQTMDRNMQNMTAKEFEELDKLAGQIVDWRRKHGVALNAFSIGLAHLLNLHEELKEQLTVEGIIEKALENRD